MKTAKQWVEESNWSDELKELFWERAGVDFADEEQESLTDVIKNVPFWWHGTPEGWSFWKEVAKGIRTDIDRLEHGTPVSWENTYGRGTDEEYETLIRKLLLSLKGEEVDAEYDDAFTRGYNTAIREMNEKIDEAIKKLENRFDY